MGAEPLGRRDLLRLAGACATTLWMPRSAWSQAPLADSPFTLGVASGAPGVDSVVLWTRLLAPGLHARRHTVRWEIAADEGFRQVVRQGQAEALPELGHAVHVEAAGLAPDRPYFYRFLAGGWSSPVGRTRTLPAADTLPRRLRLAYASCQRWEHGYYAAYRHMREDAPDFVLFLGDYIYEYPTAGRAVRPTDGAWAVTLEQYRARFALHRGDPDLQAMHAACPWLVTWDDHEVQNDYAGLLAGASGPPVADFAARRGDAYQAFYEHMPLRVSALARALQGGAVRVHGDYRFGRLAHLCLLDARQYRSPQACSPDGRRSATLDPAGCAAWHDPVRTLLGAAQEQWLDDRLAEAGAAWTVLGQSTLLGQRILPRRAGPGLWNDGWDGYPAARQRLLASLQRHRPANPVVLGGDIHENWVGHVLADYARPDSAVLGVEFCGTSISSRPFEPERVAERLAPNPHFVHADAARRGYGIADFTPGRLEVQLRTVDDVRRPDALAGTEARFVVEAGMPRVVRA